MKYILLVMGCLVVASCVVYLLKLQSNSDQNMQSSQGPKIVPENCYMFASPLEVKANGRDKIRITVMVLNSQGKGMVEEPVFLGTNQDLEVTAVRATTDELGRAVFDVASTKAAEYYLEAQVGRIALPQRVKIRYN